ncbi:hypothetical protein EJB05_01724, partial [Eragrostis curvula]
MMAAAGVKRPRERIKIAFTQDYEETSLLGEGGFGVVVKARHRVTGEAVAIKRVRYSDDDEGRNKQQAQRELMQEAQFLDACKGVPFLVGYHGLARDLATSDLCLLMEFVSGPSLHTYLSDDDKPPLRERTVRSLMWQLLTGARYMHQRLVVHRDIKPGNILFDGNKNVKICDLGLALFTKLPPPYAQVGTLPYMAPEMLLGKTDYDERVDTWSLGCVMAELILRRPLFESDYDDDSDEEEVGQLVAIFDVLGVPDGRTWRGFKSLPLAAEVTKKLHKKQRRKNRLRDMFPEETLSKEGFEVLSGLLTSNPNKRLTASAALKMPWFNFSKVVEELSLPQKNKEMATVPPPAVHKRKRIVIIPPAMPNVLLAAA